MHRTVAVRLEAICVRDCDCGHVIARTEMVVCATDDEAALRFAQRESSHSISPLCSRGTDPCYWIFHGPGGHVIGVRRVRA